MGYDFTECLICYLLGEGNNDAEKNEGVRCLNCIGKIIKGSNPRIYRVLSSQTTLESITCSCCDGEETFGINCCVCDEHIGMLDDSIKPTVDEIINEIREVQINEYAFFLDSPEEFYENSVPSFILYEEWLIDHYVSLLESFQEDDKVLKIITENPSLFNRSDFNSKSYEDWKDYILQYN